MSDVDPVDITVRIKNRFSDEIETLKSELKSIQNKIETNLEINDNGEIEWAKMELEDLEEIVEIVLDIDTKDIKRTKAELQILDNTVTRSTHVVDVHRQGDNFDPPTLPGINTNSGGEMDIGNLNNRDVPNRSGRDGKSLKNITRGNLGRIGDSVNKLDGAVKRAFPSMRKWMNLVAALIPMLIAMAPALLGVASAMGAVAAAGGAIVGLGLLGFEDAQERIQQFKEELNGVFEPLQTQFKPIADEILSTIPNAMEGLSRTMGDLTVFEDTFVQGIEGAVDLVDRLIDRAIELQPLISQLSERFGGMISDSVVDIFSWFVEEAYRNQDALIGLAGILGNVMKVIYNLSKAVSEIILEFQFVTELAVTLSEILNTDFVTGIGASIAKIYLMTKAVSGLIAMVNALKVALMKNPLTALAVGGLWLATESGMLDGIMGTTGVSDNGFGNGGPSGPSPTGTRGGGDTYVMRVEGDVSQKHMEQFKDVNQKQQKWRESERKKRTKSNGE